MRRERAKLHRPGYRGSGGPDRRRAALAGLADRGFTVSKRDMVCKMCATEYHGSSTSNYCSAWCRKMAAMVRGIGHAKAPSAEKKMPPEYRRGDRIGKVTPKDTEQAEAILRAAVENETAPPWVRHPIPWTDMA